MKHPIPGMPSTWLTCALVDDVEAITDKAKWLGATVLKSVAEAPETGRFGLSIDPTGADLGLWPFEKA